MDRASISAALGSIKTASDIAKLIKDSGSNLEQAEIKFKIAELVGALADAKLEIADVQSQLIEKDEQIKGLHRLLEQKESQTYVKPYYVIERDDETRDGPYCQVCNDDKNKLIRLQERGNDCWDCKVCNGFFRGEGFVSKLRKRSSYGV